MSLRVAVVGVGQTEARPRWKLALPALYKLAARRALDDAGIGFDAVDAIVFGNSPEYFEGVNAPEKWCGEAVGGRGKPVFRIHTGGTVGGSVAIAAYSLAASGIYERVLAVSGNKLGDCAHAQLGLSTVYDPIVGRSYAAGAIGAVAVQASAYMADSGCTEAHAAMVAEKARKNALNNPYAHLRLEGYTREIAAATPMLSSPLRLSDCCPQSDAACAMVFAPEGPAGELRETPAWVLGAAGVAEGVNYVGRRWHRPLALRRAAELVYARAGIADPLRELSVVEVYDAFTYQEMIWYEGLGLCAWGEGWRLIEDGRTRMDGELPVNPSGGVLCANSIGASAMVRKAEAALQVMGAAGDRQVPGARLALGHGWGGALQFHTLMVFGREKPR